MRANAANAWLETWTLIIRDATGGVRRRAEAPTESTAATALVVWGARRFGCDREDVPALLADYGWTFQITQQAAPRAAPRGAPAAA